VQQLLIVLHAMQVSKSASQQVSKSASQ